MPKLTKRAVVLSGLAVSSCAPFWPAVDPLETSKSTLFDRDADVASVSYSSIISTNPASARLGPALTYAQGTLVEFSAQKTELEHVKNGEILTLFGLGTAAGTNIVVSGGKEQLRTFGIVAAALLGLEQTVGLNAQYNTFEAGVNAVDCLLSVDSAVATSGAGSVALLNRTRTQLRQRIEQSAAEFAQSLSADSELADKINDYNGITTMALARNAERALEVYLEATISVSDPSVRAAMLADGVFKIRAGVQDQLFKAADTSKIYNAMQTAIGPPTKKIQSALASLEAAHAALLTAPGVQFRTAISELAIASVTDLMVLTDQPPPPTDPVQAAADKCVADATGKSS